jgi:hypothetical protein
MSDMPLEEKLLKAYLFIPVLEDQSLEGLEYLGEWANEVTQFKKEIKRAMDAMFPNGWHEDDAKALGSIIEGMCDTMAEFESKLKRLQLLNVVDCPFCGATAEDIESILTSGGSDVAG